MAAFVTLKDVVKEYKMGEVTITAAGGVNFEIEKGEFCVIAVSYTHLTAAGIACLCDCAEKYTGIGLRSGSGTGGNSLYQA